MQNTPSYAVRAVDHALRALILLDERGEVRLTEVAEHLGVARSTAHRMLAMLCHHGFAERGGDRRYRAGPRLAGMRRPVGRRLDLAALAHPYLDQLSRQVRETTHLMVLRGNGTRFLGGVEGPQVLRVGPRTGMLLPAHTTSGGKALLAELSPADLRALYPQGLPPGRPNALADLGALARTLATVRRRGYALNVEESETGVSAIGTCVRDPAGRAVAAIAVAAPASRYPRRRLPDLAPALRAAAARIEAELAG